MPEERDLPGRLDGLLQKISALTFRQKNQFAEEIGISRQQLDVLEIIYDQGRITMGDLCREIASACSTATDLADKLERAGYAERVREKRDRRVVRLSILPAGEEIILAIREKRRQELQQALAGCEEADTVQALEFLEALVAGLK